MLKRITTLFLTKVYLITALGFALNLHYCGQVLASVKIDAPAKVCKTLSGRKMKCCTEKHIDIQIKDSHQGAFPSFLGKLFSFHIAKLPLTKLVFNIPLTERSIISNKAPPDDLFSATPVFIKNCTFRI